MKTRGNSSCLCVSVRCLRPHYERHHAILISHIDIVLGEAAGHALLVSHNGTFQTNVQPAYISDVLAQPEHIIWLNLADPPDEDIALLRDEFGFHPLAIEDAIRSHQRPKVDSYDGYYFVVFY